MSSGLYLVACIGTTTVALPAETVEAVVRIDAVVPVPCAPPAVIGLAAIRSRVLTLLDTALIAGESKADSQLMAIISIDGHGYGLALEWVEDVIAIDGFGAVPAGLTGAWAQLADGMADHDGRAILLIQPERIVACVATSRREAA
jgi:purine-binding chemotaxis protein CheW